MNPDPAAPPRLRRLAVASIIATLATFLHYAETICLPTQPGDIGIVWYGARALLHGANPYLLVGPGRVYDWPWFELYPATAMVAAIPLAILPQVAAALVFVWISTVLLAYAVTADGWYKLPLFLSAPFVISAWVAQWSPIFTAAFSLPALGWLVAVKPNLGAAVLASVPQHRTVKIAIAGSLVLLLLSLLLLPQWPIFWISAITAAHHLHAPLFLPGGLFVTLALLRWRRPEARLIVAMACVPQTIFWQEVLPLLVVPATYRQSLLLSLISSLGVLFQIKFVSGGNGEEVNRAVGTLMIAFAYLPATLLVLQRPNEGEPSALFSLIAAALRRLRPSRKPRREGTA